MKWTIERDTVNDEIHRIRREIAEKFGGDIAAILDDARQRQSMSGRKEWRRKRSDEVRDGEPATPTANSDKASN